LANEAGTVVPDPVRVRKSCFRAKQAFIKKMDADRVSIPPT
jgi:hypothetical protein